MISPRYLASSVLLFASLAVLAGLAGCNVDVKKNQDGDEKKVDIKTPIGALHVSKDVDPADIGLPVYPGAHPVEKQESDKDEKSANVNISTSWFGLKVLAQEYQSDDPSDKLISYYNGELGKIGKVLRCQTSWHSADVSVNVDHHEAADKKNSHELTCDKQGGDTVELKVGTKENQHLVAIQPEGKGSKFALVFVQVRDREGTI